MNATWRMLSSSPPRGAIAMFQISGDVEGVLRDLGIADVAASAFGRRHIPGVDAAVVARVGPDIAWVFPHAGPRVTAALIERFEAAGIRAHDAAGDDPRLVYPEAADLIEARMLAALATAASPIAIDLLLDQPRRWRTGQAPMPQESSRLLRRLIDPPLVVALGPPNVGKSSLLNALAGRGVSLVADEPGTTRDHVGALLDLAGLVVRYVDTPGLGNTTGAGARDGEIQAAAQDLALRAAAGADLILLCGDAASGFALNPCPGVCSMRIALRADLGLPEASYDLATSVREQRGLEGLVAAMREKLVPAAGMADQRPWEFWSQPT